MLVLAAIALHGLHVLAPAPWDVLAVLGVWIVAAAAFTYRDYRAAHVTVLAALLTGSRIVPAIAVWPFHFLVPLSVYGLLLLVLPRPAALRWLRAGAFDLRTIGLIVAGTVVSGAALGAWFFAVRPDVSDLTAGMPAWPLHLLVALGLAFALLNAAMEEAIWRGVLLGGVEATTSSAAWAVVVQALSFGAAHANGFPRGVLGVVMAFVYGLMLGALRVRARGMLAPFVAHVAIDLVVFALLVGTLGRQ